MPRLIWFAVVVGAFGAGLATGWLRHKSALRIPVEQQTVAADWQRQITVLQRHIRTQDAELTSLRQRVQMLSQAQPAVARAAPAVAMPTRMDLQGSLMPPSAQMPQETEEGPAAADTPPSTTEQVVRSRFHQYLAETEGLNPEQRRQRLRALGEELRAMGEPALTALLLELEADGSGRERRAAAALLGTLQDIRALPALQKVLEREQDLLMRRAAAYGMRLLQLPETIPVLSTLLANPQDDRFVRMSAAYGLAQLGDVQGIPGLLQLFDEAEQDGQGRMLAFRALMALNDPTALPLMRQLTVSDADVSYRMAAMRFLAEHGDREALPLLQRVLDSPHEQPSVVDAAARMHAAIASGHLLTRAQGERARAGIADAGAAPPSLSRRR